MSQVVTPPDQVNKDTVYLIVNAAVIDVEMIVRWLKINNRSYTVHLYHDGMSDIPWLDQICKWSKLILVNKANTLAQSSKSETLSTLLNYTDKITWVGEGQQYPRAAEYLVNHG